MKPLELADFILHTYPDKSITPMKLQKLAYYAKVWALVAGESWVNVKFKKWAYGPVNYTIYNKYKKYGSHTIPPAKSTPALSASQVGLLKFIINNYVDYSAFTLGAMTHNEEPWKNAGLSNIISDQSIIDYYSKQPFALNLLSKEKNKPFHVLHSNTWHSFVLDMDKEEAEKFAQYSSYEVFAKYSDEANNDFKKLVKHIELPYD